MRIKTKDGCIYEVDRVEKTQTYTDGKLYANEFFFYKCNKCVAKTVFRDADDREDEMLKMENDLFDFGKMEINAINLIG